MTLRPSLVRVLAALALVFVAAGADARSAPSEFEVKAAFIANFVRFVDWPDETDTTLLVVVEPDSFGRTLETAFADVTLPMRLDVVRHSPRDPLPRCRILFAGRASGAAGLAAVAAAGPATLTIGETEEFLARGGLIRLAVMDGRVRVEVNADALKRSKLRFSSKLLGIATLRNEGDLR